MDNILPHVDCPHEMSGRLVRVWPSIMAIHRQGPRQVRFEAINWLDTVFQRRRCMVYDLGYRIVGGKQVIIDWNTSGVAVMATEDQASQAESLAQQRLHA